MNPAPNIDATNPILPDLNQALLDWAGVEALLNDIEFCTHLYEIITKSLPQQFVGENSTLTLSDARELLKTKTVRALQIRYQFDNDDWWDTLMCLPEGWRLVRIRHQNPTSKQMAFEKS